VLTLHLDENIPSNIAEGLKRLDIPISTAQDAGLLAAEDEQHLSYAAATGSVLLTHDADFLKIADERRQQGASHPGIIYAHPRKFGVGVLIKKVAAVARENDFPDLENKVLFL